MYEPLDLVAKLAALVPRPHKNVVLYHGVLALEHLHILANYEWDSKALLSIVLIGLPETKQRLALAKNRSLWSRIHTRLSLGEATPGDTAEYIAHRLRHAGCERELFNSDATALIHEQSQGRLRDTDRIATDALKLARAGRSKRSIANSWLASWATLTRSTPTDLAWLSGIYQLEMAIVRAAQQRLRT